MARKKGGKSTGFVSNGERPNVSKWVRKEIRNSVAPIVTLQNKWKAFNAGKRVMVTFIRVTAKEAGWKKPEPYRMKQEG